MSGHFISVTTGGALPDCLMQRTKPMPPWDHSEAVIIHKLKSFHIQFVIAVCNFNQRDSVYPFPQRAMYYLVDIH